MRALRLVIVCAVLAACGGRAPGSTGGESSSSSSDTPGASAGAGVSIGLGVVILTPEDGAVVNVPQVDITGQAPPETVITFNDEIVVVEASGEFAVTLALDEGPNEIQVVASDLAGNEATYALVVTYDPQG